MKRYTGIAFDRFAQGHGAEAGLLDELQPVPAPQGLGSQTRTAACDSERLRGVHVPLTAGPGDPPVSVSSTRRTSVLALRRVAAAAGGFGGCEESWHTLAARGKERNAIRR